jgi:hypothetical protein
MIGTIKVYLGKQDNGGSLSSGCLLSDVNQAGESWNDRRRKEGSEMPRKTSLNVDEILIEQLARGASQTEAGKAAGVGRKAVYLRLQKPEFRKAIEDFRSELLDQTVGKLAGGIGKAIDRLEHLMAKASPDAAQVQAARAIADLTVRFKEMHLEARLTELQTRLEAMEEAQAIGARR